MTREAALGIEQLVVAARTGKVREARTGAAHVHAVAAGGGMAPERWLALARVERAVCAFAAAHESFTQAQSAFRVHGDVAGAVDAAWGSAQAMADSGSVERAIEGTDRLAEDVAEVPALLVPTLLLRADLRRRARHFDSALRDVTTARSLAGSSTPGGAWSEPLALAEASLLLDQGLFGACEDVIRAAKRGATASARRPGTSPANKATLATFSALEGAVLVETGRFGEAVAPLREAVEALRGELRLRESARARLTLALARLELEDAAAARSDAWAARDLFAHLELHGDLAAACVALGRIAHSQGDSAAALDHFASARSAFDVAGDAKGQAACLVNGATTLVEDGRPSEAVAWATEAVRLLEGRGDPRWLAVADLTLGLAHHASHGTRAIGNAALDGWLAALLLLDSRRHEFASPAVRAAWESTTLAWRERIWHLALASEDARSLTDMVLQAVNAGTYRAPTTGERFALGDAPPHGTLGAATDALPLAPAPPLVGADGHPLNARAWAIAERRYGYARPGASEEHRLPVATYAPAPGSGVVVTAPKP